MKILKKVIFLLLGLVALIVAVYLVGPKPASPQLAVPEFVIPDDLTRIEQMVQEDTKTPYLKANNQSHLIWADSIPKKTEYVLLYLHGFSASPEEGHEMAVTFAKRYHCNLYNPRLYGHGLEEEEPMLDMNAEKLFHSAAHALAVAKKLGEKVIVMATSTGATLTMPLAANQDKIHSMIFYSPNFGLADPNSKWLSKPWGLAIVRQVIGSNYYTWDADEYGHKYWTTRYRLEALIELQALLDKCIQPEVFKAVKQPVFMGYYYKDQENQDDAISVAAIQEMYPFFGTPTDKLTKLAFPNSGRHVICNPNSSNDYETVKQATFRFAEETLGLSPASAKSDAPSDQDIAQAP
jgi:esterase/lipase